MRQKINKTKTGFTIIETMISVSLFIVIVMAGMGALLNANLLHNKSQNMRSIMDNLSFIMEDMSKNLRTGYNYKCYTEWSQNNAQSPALNDPASCSSGGRAIVFEEAIDGKPAITSDQWVYKIYLSNDGVNNFNIGKSIDGGSTWTQLNPDEIKLNGASGFTVFGAEKGPPTQPFVTIRLIGNITFKGIDTPFSLQTSVSQRVLDVPSL